MRILPKQSFLTLAAVTAALLISGCSQLDGQDTSKEPPVSSFPRVTSEAQIKLPFDAYTLSAEQDRLSLQASNLLLKQCGMRYGVTVTAPVGENPTLTDLNARRYGIIDGRRAESFGYRPAVSSAESAPRSNWEPSAAEQAVLNGPSGEAGEILPVDANGDPVPAGGCFGVVAKELGGDEPTLTQDVGQGLNKKAENDSRVQKAWSEWAECMSEKGYDYKSPWQPNNAKWPAEVGQKEIQTATDDVACRQSSNLVGIWLAVESAYQRQAIEKDPEAFKTIKNWHDKRIRAVAKALGASNG